MLLLQAGHELSGLLLLWLCSKGPFQQSQSRPGTRGTWGVWGCGTVAHHCGLGERSSNTFPVSQFLMFVLDLWCQIVMCCDPDSVVGF